MAVKLPDVSRMIGDRRRQERLNLRYDIQLRRADQEVTVRTVTDNLSGTGFYCTSDHPFAPGDRLACALHIPSERTGAQTLVLHRWVKVLRVEVRGLEPGFGIACAFEDRRGSGDHETVAASA